MPAGPNPAIVIFNALAPAVAPGNAGDGLEVRAYSQAVIYPNVVAFDAGTGAFDLFFEVGPDGIEWHGIQIMDPAAGPPDVDPPAYSVRYTKGGGTGNKPALLVPLAASWFRLRVQADVAGAGNSFTVSLELGRHGAEPLGT
jgi:hypothetical protein